MDNTQILAKEGRSGAIFLTILFVLCCFFALEHLAVFVILLLCLWLFMFRNPERVIPRLEEAFLSPCDGRILDIDYQKDRLMIKMQIAAYDVGIIRSPYKSEEVSISRRFGFLSGFVSPEIKSRFNACMTWSADCFKMMIYPEFLSCRAYGGAKVYSGDRIGFCKAGILILEMRQDIIELKVNAGDKIKSGETILGYRK